MQPCGNICCRIEPTIAPSERAFLEVFMDSDESIKFEWDESKMILSQFCKKQLLDFDHV
ncbi:hypothetical protein FACS1894172_16310 [Spirochaetia bacterium]|nr:hypothetical protein FACS1894172_16310 [Spirochaetia bacterium]